MPGTNNCGSFTLPEDFMDAVAPETAPDGWVTAKEVHDAIPCERNTRSKEGVRYRLNKLVANGTIEAREYLTRSGSGPALHYNTKVLT